MRAFRSILLLGLALSFAPLSSWASRQITDQLGRQVTIPDKVDRVVVLQHQTLNLLVQLDATDDIVGVLNNWKKQLGEGYERLAPSLDSKAQVGDLVIICAYGQCDEAEAARFKPTLVYVDRDNAMTHTNRSMPKQAA